MAQYKNILLIFAESDRNLRYQQSIMHLMEMFDTNDKLSRFYYNCYITTSEPNTYKFWRLRDQDGTWVYMYCNGHENTLFVST